MRSQFTFYKSFDDVIEDMNDNQIVEYVKTILDIQFLRIKIDDVKFDDKILNIVWKSQKHSINKSVKGYLDSQKGENIKDPYMGIYDINFIPSEGSRQQEQVKGEDKEQGQEEAKGKGKDELPYIRIITYLNKKASTSYRPTSIKTKSLIDARLNDNFKIEDFKTVIDKKVNQWLNTDDSIYIRPETLFGTKFESYLNQLDKNSNSSNKSAHDEYK